MILKPNFTLFYYSVIKGNTPFTQQDAVNILLRGNTYTYLNNEKEALVIKPTPVSLLVSGKKKIPQDILTEIFQEDIVNRLIMLQLKNFNAGFHAFEYLFSDTKSEPSYDNLAKFFLISLRYNDNTHPLTDDEQQKLKLAYAYASSTIEKPESSSALDDKTQSPTLRKIDPAVVQEQFKDYYILDNTDLAEVPRSAVSYWRIRLFVFILRDAARKCFLPLQLHKYNGVWTVPHIARRISMRGGLTSVKILTNKIRESSHQMDSLFTDLEDQQFYQMGLNNYETHILRDYIECKFSVNSRHEYQYSFVEECEVYNLSVKELINVYDPQKYYGYHYLPLDTYGNADAASPYVEIAPDGKGIWFFDHPLSTNIVNLINQKGNFEHCTYDLPNNIILSESGVI